MMPCAWAASGAETAATTTAAMANWIFMGKTPLLMFAVSMIDAVHLVLPLWRQREANVATHQQNRSDSCRCKARRRRASLYAGKCSWSARENRNELCDWRRQPAFRCAKRRYKPRCFTRESAAGLVRHAASWTTTVGSLCLAWRRAPRYKPRHLTRGSWPLKAVRWQSAPFLPYPVHAGGQGAVHSHGSAAEQPENTSGASRLFDAPAA